MRAVIVVVALCSAAQAFVPVAAPPTTTVQCFGYVPSGMSKEQYEALKKKEAAKKQGKNFGEGGARGFTSRSMQSFVEALEKGEAKHLMPVDPRKVKSGEIPLKDVPYMQRGGSWDNKDLKKGKGWMTTGFGMRAYNDGKAEERKKNQYDDRFNSLKPSTNFWGTSVGADWTGKGGDGGSIQQRAKKNGVSNDQQMWRDAGALSTAEARKRGAAPKLNSVKTSNDKNNNGGEKRFFGLF